jgi:hypothetical protein
MDNKICFLIPIYPPHYNYLTFLNDLSEEHTFTIIFICTYSRDKALLIDCLRETVKTSFSNIDYIVLQENHNISKLIHIFDDSKKGIITIKKFYGLYHIINNEKYDFHYIACVDSEIQFINAKNIYDKFKLYCDRRIAICGDTTIRSHVHNFLDTIHDECIKFIKTEDEKKAIQEHTKEGKLYFWFSDINIYDVKILPDFFNYIEFDDTPTRFVTFLSKMNFMSFDYVIYFYYCILYHNYRLLCMADYNIKRNWSLEAAPYQIYDEVKQLMNYTTNMVIKNCYTRNLDKFKGDEPILVYHLNDGRYHDVYNKRVDYLDN